MSEEIKETANEKLLYQIASSLKSSRFILALFVLIPSMMCFGYALYTVDSKDKIVILNMINTIAVMIITFYFSERLQGEKRKLNEE